MFSPQSRRDSYQKVNLRMYNPGTQYQSEILNVYKFYFEEIQYNLTQRKQTLYLAMAYFTQTIMRCPWLQKSEIGIIASSALLLASKFDEIDYSLPSIKKIKREMEKSQYFKNYDTDFAQWNFISCEKEICKRLNWNFNQTTPYHFFESLVNQGILKPKDKIGLTNSNDHMSQMWLPTPTSSKINIFSTKNTYKNTQNSACKKDQSSKMALCKSSLKNWRFLARSQCFINSKSFVANSPIDISLGIKKPQTKRQASGSLK